MAIHWRYESPHYAGTLGLDIATVGLILMFARFTDVVTDPIIGELSDRWRTPIGRRIWLLIGVPVMILGCFSCTSLRRGRYSLFAFMVNRIFSGLP